MLARAARWRNYPVLAKIIPIRRCNLACTYWNEYDKPSAPAPSGEMLRRIDLLAAPGAGMITFSGGESLFHPDLEQLVRDHSEDIGKSNLNPLGVADRSPVKAGWSRLPNRVVSRLQRQGEGRVNGWFHGDE